MIRVAIFLIIVGALSIGAAWLADRPGDVVITWQGWRIETSIMVAALAVLAAMIVLGLVLALLRTLLRTPFIVNRMRRARRSARAYHAISKGLIAVGSGDMSGARKFSAEASRLAPNEPLALLLNAQSAQIAGDRDSADRAFRALAGRPDTKALGLHGLFIEARRRDDLGSARAYAEEAVRSAPSLGWAGRAVLESLCRDGDWVGALVLLERGKDGLDKTVYRRQRAVLLTARALAIEESDRDVAKALVLEAVKLAPTLVPAAALAGRLLGAGGELRKATRIIDKAWRANPHPELAQAFSELRSGEAARDRLKRITNAAKNVPDNIESSLAIARAALDAREFATSRGALTPYLAAPTKRVALLMAAIERAEHGDEGRAREWMARALQAAPDPAWTADGYVSDRWLPISPVSGRLDAFEWRVPLTGMLSDARAIEPEAPVVPVAEAVLEEPDKGPDATQPSATTLPALSKAPTPEPGAAAAEPKAEPKTAEASAAEAKTAEPKPELERRPALKSEPKAEQKAEPVIPLVHAPDDPGPEAAEESEPRTVPEEARGWRSLFR